MEEVQAARSLLRSFYRLQELTLAISLFSLTHLVSCPHRDQFLLPCLCPLCLLSISIFVRVVCPVYSRLKTMCWLNRR